MNISKGGRPITTIEEWQIYAPPKSQIQWVDGRSAKELARYWLAESRDCFPDEIQEIVLGHHHFGRILHWSAEPEIELAFDAFRGPRNTGMLVIAEDASGPYLIGVEGKADESFSQYLFEAMCSAYEELLLNERSNAVTRIDCLIKSLFKKRINRCPSLKGMRYQLMTATAGLCAEASRRGICRAVLLVQEFVTDRTKDDLHMLNSKDLSSFAARISEGSITQIVSGKLEGPVSLVTDGAHSVDIYIGKLTHRIRQ